MKILIALIVLTAIIGLIRYLVDKKRNTEYCRNRFDDLHIVGIPDKYLDRSAELFEGFEGIVIPVPNDEVKIEADQHRKFFEAANNRYNVQVYEHYFQYGIHRTETAKEYIKRIRQEIAESVCTKHASQADGDPDFYKKFIKSVKGIKYEA